MRLALLIGVLCVLTGCAPPPYAGVDRNSYGGLVDYVNPQTGSPVTPPLCDPDAKYSDVNELSRQITGLLFKPISGLDKIDPAIVEEGLQSNFLMPGDVTGYTVTIPERNDNGIVFWYTAEVVTLPEIANAAKAFCGRRGKQAIYEGSSKKCSAPILLPVVINGKSTTENTYVISSFQCVGSLDSSSPDDGLAVNNPVLVSQIQKELARLGFLQGLPDGHYGRRTRAAIMNFQRNKGLVADGLPSQDLLKQLEEN